MHDLKLENMIKINICAKRMCSQTKNNYIIVKIIGLHKIVRKMSYNKHLKYILTTFKNTKITENIMQVRKRDFFNDRSLLNFVYIKRTLLDFLKINCYVCLHNIKLKHLQQKKPLYFINKKHCYLRSTALLEVRLKTTTDSFELSTAGAGLWCL